MWPFSKKKKEETKPADQSDEDDEEKEQAPIPQDAELGTKVELIQADITKINGVLESLKEARKSSNERFTSITEQLGEFRGMISDVQRTTGMIEVKATKAADLVESVHPDKLMIQVQKEDGKIEGLRGMLEAKEEMMKNIMDQLKKIRDQIAVFRGIEQVIKLNEEVKDELMSVKKMVAAVERHADRVDNVFIESQKSFEAFNTFADKLESLRSDLKDLTAKVDKLEVATGTFLKKKDFEDRIEKIEKHDKKVKDMLDKAEKTFKELDEKSGELEHKLRGEFEFKIEKAEILSKAFEDLLHENPMFAEGLKLQEYLNKHLSGAPQSSASGKEDAGQKKEEDKPEEGADAKPEEKPKEEKK